MIIDVQPKELGIPTKAYYAIEEVKEVSTITFDIYANLLLLHVKLNNHHLPSRMPLRKARRFLFMCPQKLLLMKLKKLVNSIIYYYIGIREGAYTLLFQ